MLIYFIKSRANLNLEKRSGWEFPKIRGFRLFGGDSIPPYDCRLPVENRPSTMSFKQLSGEITAWTCRVDLRSAYAVFRVFALQF